MSEKHFRYLHTVDDDAAYYDGKQIVKASPHQAIPTVASLSEIRAQQRASRKWRLAQRYAPHARCDYRKIIV